MKQFSVEKLTEGYGLIEGPVWHPELGLIFSDVTFGGAFAVDRDGLVSPVLEHRRGMGGMALHEAGGLVVSGRNVSFKPLPTGDTIELFAHPLGADGAGFNDLTTDAHGRVYVGDLRTSPFDANANLVAGELWMIDLDGSAVAVADDVQLTNGLGFSPDGATLYHSDSRRGAVMQYDVRTDGTLGPKRHFADTPVGAPDGLAVAEDGSVWVALASGGGGVAVYASDGTIRGTIDIELPMCTSVCFGGDDLQDLYIVSGSEGASSDRSGAVFVARVDVPGLAVPPARVSLS